MLINILAFVVVFTLIALSHEIGHLIWAKRAGIRVHEFALGFGPRLFSVERNNTHYSLNLIPILGYVKIAGEGENEEDKACPESELFTHKTPQQKFKAIFAGPAMNILLAFILLSISFSFMGIPKDLSNEIASVNSNSPAAKAGIKAGDRLIAIDNHAYPKMEDAISYIHQSREKQLLIKLVRNGVTFEAKATPKFNPAMKVSLLGFSAIPIYEKVGVFAAIYYAVLQTGSMVALMFVIIWQLITGAVSLSNLAGPVGIAQITGKYAHTGLFALANLTALISVNIGVLNLLPLPALDGGHLVFILIEWVRKKPVDPHLENKIHAWGLAALLALMLLVTVNDIFRLFRSQ